MTKVIETSIAQSPQRDDPDRLIGWASIAKYAGYCIRQTKNFEKIGLVIHRKPHGKRSRVWTSKQEVAAFIKQYHADKGGSKNDPEPDKVRGCHWPLKWQKSGMAAILAGLLLAALIVLVQGYVWDLEEKHFPTGEERRVLGSYHCDMDDVGRLHQLKILDQYGHYVRTVWSLEEQLVAGPPNRTSFDTRDMISLSSKNLSPRILLECLNNVPRFHSLTESGDVPLPDLSITTKMGETMNETVVVKSVDWVETKEFMGWLLVANCKEQFFGCLLLLEPELKKPVVRGILYNPGNISSVLIDGGNLLVGGVLNAREKQHAPYVAALFLVGLNQFLDTRKQLNPFSEKTISSKERRAYYQLKGISVCEPEVYISFNQRLPRSPRLNEWPGGCQVIFQEKTDQELSFVFDKKLKYQTKIIDEHTPYLNLALDQKYRAVRFQYWQKDNWGPWLGE